MLVLEFVKKRTRRWTLSLALSTLFLIVLTICSLCIGSTDIYSPHKAVSLLLQGDPIAQYRLERSVLAILTGSALSLAGFLMQVATRNPLADPFLLGVSGGALTFALLSILVFRTISLALSTSLAFVGAMTVYGITTVLASIGGYSASALVLAGISMSMLFSAISYILLYVLALKIGVPIVFYLMGSLSLASSSDVMPYVTALTASLALSLSMWKRINVLIVSDEYSMQLGYNPKTTRLAITAIASFITSVSVSIVGIVGFIGLIAPHVARFMVGSDSRIAIPMSVIVGSILTLSGDIVIRILSASTYLGELPLGVVTSLMGTPALCAIAMKRLRSL